MREKKKGLIALDIDGTITHEKYSVPKNVVDYLQELDLKGWQVLIITGRSYSFSVPILQCFPFPVLFGMENGAAVITWPEEKMLRRFYMPNRLLQKIEDAFLGLEGAMAVYSGFEFEDQCFWKESGFAEKYPNYFQELVERQKQKKHIVESFDLQALSHFPIVKCIGVFDQMVELAERLKVRNGLSVAIVKDPFDTRFYLLLVTAKEASKGEATRDIYNKFIKNGPIIAAGNDDNDYSLLKAADIPIAMTGSPNHLLEVAQFIAPTVQEEGIVFALQQAVGSVDTSQS